MQAIILAGGFGTRLRSVLPDVPKPMAPIGGKPFLSYLLRYLHSQGFTSILFSVHYLKETIQTYFQSYYAGMSILHVDEDEPLGTGGAIVHSLAALQQKNQPVFVLNGDTFVKLDYQAMYRQHIESNAMMTMALRAVTDCSRYGKVIEEKNTVVEFREKGEEGPGCINAGVYLIDPALFTSFALPKQFSIEKDFILPHLPVLKPQAFNADDYFIDIGIPEDYVRATHDLPTLL